MAILGASGWRPRQSASRVPARRRTACLLALVVGALFLFAGCGGDEPDGKKKSGSESSTRVSATTGSSESEEAATPAPATGPVIEEDYYSFHLPEDLDWDLDPGDTIAFADGPELEPYEIAVQTNDLMTGDTWGEASTKTSVLLTSPVVTHHSSAERTEWLTASRAGHPRPPAPMEATLASLEWNR